MTRLFESCCLALPGTDPLGYSMLMYGAGTTYVMTLESEHSPPIPCTLILENCPLSADGVTHGAFQMNGEMSFSCECKWNWEGECGFFTMTLLAMLGDSGCVGDFILSYEGTIKKRTLELSLSAESENGLKQVLRGSLLSPYSMFKQKDAASLHPPMINCLNSVKKEEFEIQESLLSGCLYLSFFNDTVMSPPVFTLKGLN